MATTKGYTIEYYGTTKTRYYKNFVLSIESFINKCKMTEWFGKLAEDTGGTFHKK